MSDAGKKREYERDFERFREELRQARRIALVGLTNAGKSSLFNAIFGEKIAPVSAKAGFTREARTESRFGVLFTDTPGLQGAGEDEETILSFVFSSDLVVLVLNAAVGVTDFDILIHDRAAAPGRKADRPIPLIVAINKADQVDAEELAAVEASVRERLPHGAAVTVSAKTGMNIEALIHLIHSRLPKPGQLWFAVHQRSEALKRTEARRQLWLSAGSAAAAALIPLPVADIFLITPIQIYLVLKIGTIYGYEISYDRAGELVATIGGSLTLQGVGRQIVKFVPGLGSVVGAAVAFAGTAALGETAILYFERGTEVSREMLRRRYREWKALWQARYASWNLEEKIGEAREAWNLDEKVGKTRDKFLDLFQKLQETWEDFHPSNDEERHR
ncbi:MAG: GTP-binding protein [Deltaproteobacteria bacterium]|nr:MAG: GTP-binding protein [Deltaproteobacteria bacterium]